MRVIMQREIKSNEHVNNRKIEVFKKEFLQYMKDIRCNSASLATFESCLKQPYFRQAIIEDVINPFHYTDKLIQAGEFRQNLHEFFEKEFYLQAWKEDLINHEYLIDTGYQPEHQRKLLKYDDKGLKLLRRIAQLDPPIEPHFTYGDQARDFIEYLYGIRADIFEQLDFDDFLNLTSIEAMKQSMNNKVDEIRENQRFRCVIL